ncbi:MAG: 2,3-bisphosphoglycerate-independent phosphoglycerate mutase [Armatimonadetes bacterium]|nr:2,3-bisphosphoglycerate-independent phosphoglycerate mutase [Armatimonadota bacterium]
MKKILYVILDGLGDRPVAELGNRTPLEAARAPHMDRLAAQGRQGLVQTVGEGIAPESDVAVMAILGYDPHRYHTGRGPIEAVGAVVSLHDGDLALRGNFATLGEGWRIVDRRAGRDLTAEEIQAFADAVNRDVMLAGAHLEMRATIGHRCVVVISAEDGALSADITNTDPAYGRLGGLGVAKAISGPLEVEESRPIKEDPRADRAADLVNAFTRQCRDVLEHHPLNAQRRAQGKMPANIILLRDAGDHLPPVPSMRDAFGVDFACFVEMPVERGIARLLGMSMVEVPPSGRDPARVYPQWAAKAADALKKHGGVYLHLKGPDEPGHDGDFQGKTQSIEWIDAHFFGEVLPKIDLRETVVAITADHATPCVLKGHSADPVPLLISGGGVEPDGAGPFGEQAGAKGALGKMRGVDVIPLLVRLAGA